jgi:hypothetical protein
MQECTNSGMHECRNARMLHVPAFLRFCILAFVVVAGCARPEQLLLERFFGASRLRDTTALQAVATVVFEPREHGIVRTFEITDVTPERVDGSGVAKEVTVETPLVLFDGRTVQTSLVMTLRRADASGPWRVVAFRDAGASAPSRQP